VILSYISTIVNRFFY
jgi:hypothetical protein